MAKEALIAVDELRDRLPDMVATPGRRIELFLRLAGLLFVRVRGAGGSFGCWI
jgi:hypothetical protein